MQYVHKSQFKPNQVESIFFFCLFREFPNFAPLIMISSCLVSNGTYIKLSSIPQKSANKQNSFHQISLIILMIPFTHVTQLLVSRLGLLASICQSTTRYQVMTRG